MLLLLTHRLWPAVSAAITLSSAILALLFATAASAQTTTEAAVQAAQQRASSAPMKAVRGQALGWRTELGIGVIVNPENVGGDDYNVTPIPYFDFRFFDEQGTKYFANVPQGIGGYFYRKRNVETGGFLNLGASIAPGFNVRDDSIPGVEEIGLSVEARINLEAGAKKWSAGATLAQDVGSGHEGAYLDLSLARRGSIGRPGGFYAVGPVLRIGDDTYKSSFFSVAAQEPANPALPAYSADAGVERVGLQGLMSIPVGTSKWRWTSILRASQLIGDAADSPIVTEETQLFFLTSFTRTF